MKIDAILVAAVMALSMPAPALAAYRIVDRIKVPDGNFDYATFDPTTGHVFMPRGAFTTVIDAKSGQVSTFSDGAADHIALPIPDTNVLILTERNGAIRILDKISGKIVKDLAGEKNPNSAAYDPVTKLTFVMNKDSGTATIVDAKAGQAVGRIPVSPNTLEFPVADGAGMIFDNIETTGEIAVIDARLRKVVRVIKLSGCEEPSGLAYAAGLLISACGNGVAKIVKAGDGSEVASVPIGHGPDAVIYDPKRKMAFVPCGRDGVLDVIAMGDPTKIALVQQLKTEQGSRTGTIDPGTGRLYVMASKPDMAHMQPNGRPARLPGSWEVLVIGP